MRKDDILNISDEFWHESGLLNNSSDRIKEYTIRLLNLACKKMHEISPDEELRYEISIYSIVPRIVNVVLIGVDELYEIINEIRVEFQNIDYDSCINNIDAICEFNLEYVKNKIIEIKYRMKYSCCNGSDNFIPRIKMTDNISHIDGNFIFKLGQIIYDSNYNPSRIISFKIGVESPYNYISNVSEIELIADKIRENFINQFKESYNE